MRLTCPHCGERPHDEFAYRGDATLRRPDPAAPADPEAEHSFVYLRDNPVAGHREHWLHAFGCRTLLVVTRDPATHAIRSIELAAP
ncbi:MAG: sarcosine oxidase subunit delta [Hyphomicrobiales bacterium]|nr:sarcosine oxidase subunit delta [Hyphomicrobiales bacterium]MDE2017125.1 sarcosine oxidase subunit delta [Hyphomicrobiales bacterium]